MAVIIDTFEVINDAQAEASSPASEAPQSGPVSNIKPADIESVFEHQQLRDQRIRAH